MFITATSTTTKENRIKNKEIVQNLSPSIANIDKARARERANERPHRIKYTLLRTHLSHAVVWHFVLYTRARTHGCIAHKIINSSHIFFSQSFCLFIMFFVPALLFSNFTSVNIFPIVYILYNFYDSFYVNVCGLFFLYIMLLLYSLWDCILVGGYILYACFLLCLVVVVVGGGAAVVVFFHGYQVRKKVHIYISLQLLMWQWWCEMHATQCMFFFYYFSRVALCACAVFTPTKHQHIAKRWNDSQTPFEWVECTFE